MVSAASVAMRQRTLPWECYKSLMLWELEPHKLRPTGLGIQTLTLTPQVAHDFPLSKHSRDMKEQGGTDRAACAASEVHMSQQLQR